MKQVFASLSVLLFVCSCTTVDMEKKVMKAGASQAEGRSALIVVPVETPPPAAVVIERPVYVPEEDALRASASYAGGILSPSEYSHAAVVYDFGADFVYEVYTQPLRVTDIRLEPGEQAAEPPFISDSDRFQLGAGVSYENGQAVQHIYVKPTTQPLSASLIINTDRRAYHIILRSYRDTHMPMVRWRYPSPLPGTYIRPAQERTSGTPESSADAAADSRFLSFNYRVSYRRFRKPSWFPELVYDDAKKTYLCFPAGVLQRELPAVFENRSDIVNYRVAENLVIIDKLIETVTVKIGNTEIVVEKRKGKPKL